MLWGRQLMMYCAAAFIYLQLLYLKPTVNISYLPPDHSSRYTWVAFFFSGLAAYKLYAWGIFVQGGRKTTLINQHQTSNIVNKE